MTATSDPPSAQLAAGPDSHLVNRVVAHVLWWGLCATAGFALVAVPLAMLGWFSAVTVVGATVVVAAVLAWWNRDNPITIEAAPAATATVLVVLAAVSLLGLLRPTQHFTTNRDPGIYATTGLWLDAEGDLLVAGMPPVLEGIDGVTVAGGGYVDVRDDGRLYAQFSHMTHVLLGTADALAGPAGLVRINVLVGAAALLAVFAVAQRVSSGWPAAIAVAVVAVSLPQIYFTRGPYSEPISQLLLAGGLLVVVSSSRLTIARGALAGLLLGSVVGSRIDGVLIVCALVALVIYLATLRQDRAGALAPLGALAAAAAVAVGIGMLDLHYFSPVYLADLWDKVRQAALAAVVLAALGAVGLAARSPRRTLGRLLAPHRDRLALAAAGLTALVLVVLLVVRPRVQQAVGAPIDLIAGLQGRQGLAVDATRSYAEESFVWFTWYLGVPLVLAGIAGAAASVWRMIARGDWRCGAVLLTLGLPTLVYLWRPSITPDQIWAMRRFVPFAFPWIAICAAVAIESGRAWLERRSPRPAATTGAYLAVAGVLAIGPALVTSGPFLDHREHRLTYGTLAELCDVIDGRLVLVDDGANLGSTFTQPVAAGCGVPAAHASLDDAELLSEAARRLALEGDQLLLLTARPDDVAIDHQVEGTVPFDIVELERSVERPPEGEEPNDPAVLYVLRAEP